MSERKPQLLETTPQPNIKINKHRLLLIFDLAILAAGALVLFIPLYTTRFFWSHDEAQLLWRMTAFHDNIQNGEFFCRWFPDFARGLGLPFLEFFPVLFLYLGSAFQLLNFGTIDSAKAAIALVTIFGSVSVYFLSRDVWGRTGGIISATLFTFVPYRVFDLYVRGDVNEYTAIAILPLNLFLIARIFSDKNKPVYAFVLVFGIAATAMAHYPSAVIQFPLLAFWSLILFCGSRWSSKKLFLTVSAFILGLGIASPFWISAFSSRHLVQMEGMTHGFADYRHQFINPAQWISTYWNFGASVQGPGDTISFQIGNFALILTMLGLSRIFLKIKSGISSGAMVLAWLFFLVTATFLTWEISSFLWKTIPLLPLLQFPYRLLQVPALMAVLLAGSVGPFIEKRNLPWQISMTVLLITIIIITSLPRCRVGEYLDLKETDLTPQTITRVKHTHCTGEFIPAAVGKRFPPKEPFNFMIEKIPEDGYSRAEMEKKLETWIQKAPHIVYWSGSEIPIGNASVTPKSIEIISGEGTILSQSGTPTKKSVNLDITESSRVRYAQFYFQGWNAFLDSAEIPLGPDPDTGLIVISLPPGQHNLRLEYRNLPVSRKLTMVSAGFLLLSSLLFIIPGIFRGLKRKTLPV